MTTRKTTRSEGAETPQPADRVTRQFTAQAPNDLWVDLTYIRTHSGWVYAAFILDVFSRMAVGWQVSTTMHTGLALDAPDMGLWALAGPARMCPTDPRLLHPTQKLRSPPTRQRCLHGLTSPRPLWT
ncbi:DDE-type integrase/transposase/recombinase [Gordonia polyisoprenivorans]|nr:DDE-type integrase/transposase/recombinase [Gordonia polyisoprenivorans]